MFKKINVLGIVGEASIGNIPGVGIIVKADVRSDEHDYNIVADRTCTVVDGERRREGSDEDTYFDEGTTRFEKVLKHAHMKYTVDEHSRAYLTFLYQGNDCTALISVTNYEIDVMDEITAYFDMRKPKDDSTTTIEDCQWCTETYGTVSWTNVHTDGKFSVADIECINEIIDDIAYGEIEL